MLQEDTERKGGKIRSGDDCREAKVFPECEREKTQASREMRCETNKKSENLIFTFQQAPPPSILLLSRKKKFNGKH